MNRHKLIQLKNWISAILVVLILFASFVAFVNIMFNLLYTKTHVKGFSMQPTLNINVCDPQKEGDTIYINKYASYTNNDIVVAKPTWHDNYIIKRLVGMPGDKIQIKEFENYYSLFVNDQFVCTKEKKGNNSVDYKTDTYRYFELYKNFLNNEKEFSQWIRGEGENKYIQLGDDDYFLMGDNWGHTTDSLTHGPMKKSEIVGKVDLVVDVNNKNPFVSLDFFMKKLFSF